MKKVILFFVTLLALGQSAIAYDFSAVAPTGQTLYYQLIDGNAMVTSEFNVTPNNYSTAPSGVLVIPDSVLFYGTTYSVTSIGNNAFSGCNGLTSVIIPNSVISIGHSAFSGCNGLTSISIPNSVNSIGNYAFAGCSSLTSVAIPNSVITIGYGAFSGCNGLHSVTIPASVSTINDDAFRNCSSLSSIVVDSNNTVFDSRENCNAIIHTSNNRLIVGCKNTTIPNTIVSIGSKAFFGCSGLTSINIPNTVFWIGYGAFTGCMGASLAIPNSVTNIGNAAFEGVRHIEYYGIASGAPWGALTMNGIVDGVFVFSSNDKDTLLAYIGEGGDVVVPNSVISIGNNAFHFCNGLTSVTIPVSVTSIGQSAFQGCSGLTSVSIPASVTSIGNYAFSHCTGLTSVIIPNSVISIGHYAFSGCNGLTTVSIPTSVTSIGQSAFQECSGLTTVVFNAEHCSFDGDVFLHSTNISRFIFGDSVNYIPAHCCRGCSGLTTVSIPTSVTSIGQSAFQDCSGLTTVSIPTSVTSIGSAAFSSCSSLTSVVFNAEHCSFDGDVFLHSTNISSFIFGDSARFIPANCCRNISSLVSVTISNSITSIGDSAFSGCSGLLEITSHAMTAPSLGAEAFLGVLSTIPVNIPCGSQMSYYSRWNHFSNFVEDEGFSFSVQSDDETMGIVSILTQPTCQTPHAVIYATANDDYRFDHWSDGTNVNPYLLTVTQDTTLVAHFVPTESINDVYNTSALVFAVNGQIVVNGNGLTVTIYDITGHTLPTKHPANQSITFDVPASGIYFVKVGTRPARKVVVLR